MIEPKLVGTLIVSYRALGPIQFGNPLRCVDFWRSGVVALRPYSDGIDPQAVPIFLSQGQLGALRPDGCLGHWSAAESKSFG